MTRAIRGFGRFWVDFVVGDDWRTAVAVVIAAAAAMVAVRLQVASTAVIAISFAVLMIVICSALVLTSPGTRRGRS
jgi:hypothetical protein